MKKHWVMFIAIGLGSLAVSCDKCATGKPKSDCFCTEQYDPVCGCDGVTYGNSCDASCNGVHDYSPGECK